MDVTLSGILHELLSWSAAADIFIIAFAIYCFLGVLDRSGSRRLLIASFGGSWTFLFCFAVFLFIWIVINSTALIFQPIDPFPYILLNLFLSCLAAIQAPVIMMSQNRQEAKDRIRAQHDYQVNLKAEFEVRQLHEKIDHLISHQWERLVAIQELQLEILEEINQSRVH